MSLENRLMLTWAVILARIMGLKMSMQGIPPAATFLLLSNYLGYLDAVVYWRYLHNTYIAKSEIRDWPGIGFIARLARIIFIERGTGKDIDRINNIIMQHLNGNEGIILFPEGTSSKGTEVRPFKSSLLQYPASHNIPVYYASIAYFVSNNEHCEAWRDVCWWVIWRLLIIFGSCFILYLQKCTCILVNPRSMNIIEKIWVHYFIKELESNSFPPFETRKIHFQAVID